MKVRPAWQDWLHRRRKRQCELVFKRCPKKLFDTALELGAGDGYQGRMLADYVNKLVCTDFDPSILENESSDTVAYMVADAEALDGVFEPGCFDLIYSSSVLEHLTDPQKALVGMGHILKDSGVMVHVMPSQFWKLCTIALYPVYLLVESIELTTSRDGLRTFVARAISRQSGRTTAGDAGRGNLNNPRTPRRRRPLIRRILTPEIHGVSDSHLAEFRAFSTGRWLRELEMAGFRVLSIRRGLVS